MLKLLTKDVRRPSRDELFDQDLLESTSEGCWVFDCNFVTLYANRALCAWLGYREGELVGTHLMSFVAEESRPTLERQAALRDLLPHASFKLTLLRSDGQRLYGIFNTSRLTGPDGSIVGCYAFVTDITQRHNEEVLLEHQRKQAQEAVERLNRFLDSICRDIKDPLSAILGLTEMISSGEAATQPGGAQDYAGLCTDAGRQLMRTVENLSLWSRLQLNQVPIEPQYYELDGLLGDVLEELTPRSRRMDIRVENRIARSGLCVFADLPAVSIALHHVLDNAMRFSRPGGTVELDASSTLSGIVHVQVRDHGPGIAPDQLENLFRIDRHRATPGPDGETGSGLGLLITRALVEKMGGTILVDSACGAGTTVTVALPGGAQDAGRAARRIRGWHHK